MKRSVLFAAAIVFSPMPELGAQTIESIDLSAV